jgi:hypothetical protein
MEICKRAPAGRKKNEEDRTKKVRMKKGKKYNKKIPEFTRQPGKTVASAGLPQK